MTATIGIITAMAIVAPLVKPPEELPLVPEALSAERVDEADVEVCDKVDGSAALGVNVTTGCVDVIVVTTGPGALDGDCVTIDVTCVTTVVGARVDAGGTVVVDGGIEVSEVTGGSVVVEEEVVGGSVVVVVSPGVVVGVVVTSVVEFAIRC